MLSDSLRIFDKDRIVWVASQILHSFLALKGLNEENIITLINADETVKAILVAWEYLTQTTLFGWPPRLSTSSFRQRSQTLTVRSYETQGSLLKGIDYKTVKRKIISICLHIFSSQ